MSDQERLEVIKKNHAFGKGEEWEFTVLTDDIDWLIQQAEQVQWYESEVLRYRRERARNYKEKARLREALEFYADPATYEPVTAYIGLDAEPEDIYSIDVDKGEEARKALNDQP